VRLRECANKALFQLLSTEILYEKFLQIPLNSRIRALPEKKQGSDVDHLKLKCRDCQKNT